MARRRDRQEGQSAPKRAVAHLETRMVLCVKRSAPATLQGSRQVGVRFPGEV